MYAILFLIFCFFVFYRLGESQIENWDEARHGISAYEMIQSGDYIKNTYCYETDLWNLKPPLSFWTIAASYRVFGYNTFALRFPSALSFTIMFVMLACFIHHRFGYISTIAFMVLFTSYADLFLSHFGRHADADAVYNMLYTASMLSLLYTDQNPKMIYASGFIAALAFLTKSFHAAVLFVVIGVYVVLKTETRNLRVIVKLIAASASPILLWMIMRFRSDGFDFIGSMFGVDVVNRINDSETAVLAGEATTILHYIMHYRPAQILLLIIALSLLTSLIDHFIFERQRVIVHSQADHWLYGLWILAPCIVFELSSATPTWYYYPTIIGLIVLASVLFGQAVTVLVKWKKQARTAASVCLLAIMFLETGLILVYSARSVTSMYHVIKHTEMTHEQTAIVELISRESELAGREAYVLKDTNSYQMVDKWEQRDVLAAELYADLRCCNGGIQGFMENSESILIISYDQYKQNDSLLSEYTIACEDEFYRILTH